MRLDCFEPTWPTDGRQKLPPRSRAGLRAACLAALYALASAGCSVSLPMSSMVSHSSDDVTGSIGHPFFSDSLNPEDRRRAIAAMTTALDPQGSGSTVAWDNPDSGVKGNFVPMGNAYPENDLVCRDFAAEFALKTGDRSMRGTACADKSGHWTITDAKPWKKI